MRSACRIFALAGALFWAARLDAQSLTGYWEIVGTRVDESVTALGFSDDGRFQEVATLVEDARYSIDARRITIIRPGGETQVADYRLSGDELDQDDGKTPEPARKQRLGSRQATALPIVGVWRYALPGGQIAYDRYLADGTIQTRIPMHEAGGRYSISGDALTLDFGTRKNTLKFEFSGGDLLLTRADAASPDRLRRVDDRRWYGPVERATDEALAGYWEPEETSSSGMASALSFGGDGAFGQVILIMGEAAYTIEGEELVMHPPEGGKQRARFVIRDDELYMEGHDKSAFKRIGAAPRGSSSIVGIWKSTDPGSAAPYQRYFPDGIVQMRIGTPEQSGRYSAARGTVTLEIRGQTTNLRYEIAGDSLMLSEPGNNPRCYRRVPGGRWYELPPLPVRPPASPPGPPRS
jgi:hypothetical protein